MNIVDGQSFFGSSYMYMVRVKAVHMQALVTLSFNNFNRLGVLCEWDSLRLLELLWKINLHECENVR